MSSFKQWLSVTVFDQDPFNERSAPSYRNMLSILGLVLWHVLIALIIYWALHPHALFADSMTHLPGDDASEKLEAAGILLKTLDTGLFKWGARLFAGICIMSSAWSLKEQRFGIAIICVIGAIIFGTAPRWVKNIFDIGDNQSIFSKAEDHELFESKSIYGVYRIGDTTYV